VPLISRPVLRLAADAFDQLQIGVLLGSFTAILVMFILPVTLLGTISPFAIRLAITDPNEAGRISGNIYAISTLGSFVGTFLPVLILIPLVGTTRTFLIFSLYLIFVALIGLWLSSGWKRALTYGWMPLILIILSFYFSGGAIKKTSGQIYETESAYNYIQVLEEDGYRLLRLNEGQGVHSMWHPTEINFDGPWKQFLVAPFFNTPDYMPEQVDSMAIIGLAAGTTVRQATDVFGPIPIDGYEIDPKIIEIGRAYFDMNQPNLVAIAQDGRWGLAKSDREYSIIAIDAYRPPYIPWHLTTREFFHMVRTHLKEDGVMVINVGRSPTDRRLIEGLVGTISSEFSSVYVVDIPYTFNSIIYATVHTTSIENFYNNLIYLYTRLDAHPILIQAMQTVVANLQPLPDVETVYTDDWAPIEWITNNMVLNYVLLGDMEALQ
jgi:predicted membrane-bound spermidine synthase